MKQFIIIILLAFTLLSCGKKQEIKISAINPVTGAPYPSLKYTIIEEKTGAFEEKYKTVAEGTLNENGVALVSLRLKNRSYLIHVETPENNCYKEPVDKTFEKNSTSFDFVFEMAPCAYLNLKIKNISCINETDEIFYKRIWATKNNSTNGITKYGCLDFDGGFFDLPIGDYKYEWDVTKNGITTHHDSLFSLTENQYYTFSIEY